MPRIPLEQVNIMAGTALPPPTHPGENLKRFTYEEKERLAIPAAPSNCKTDHNRLRFANITADAASRVQIGNNASTS